MKPCPIVMAFDSQATASIFIPRIFREDKETASVLS